MTQSPDNRQAVALVTRHFASNVGPALIEACRKSSVHLRIETDMRRYKEEVRLNQNIITWGVKMPPSWYRKKRDKNFLFVENGLLSQRDGFFIDECGWFDCSGLTTQSRFHERPTRADIGRMHEIVERRLGGRSKHASSGPWMFAVQNDSDAGCRFHFPSTQRRADATDVALGLLANAMRDTEVLVRPHPRFRPKWRERWSQYSRHFGPRWRVDTSPNCYETLRACRGLITVNSTVATEAIALGIPVAALGHGTFTGAGVVLECAEDPTRLQRAESWSAPFHAASNYLAAVLRQQIPYAPDLNAALTVSGPLRAWLERAAVVQGASCAESKSSA